MKFLVAKVIIPKSTLDFNSSYQIGCLLIVQLFLAADFQLCIGFANCCLNFNRSIYRYLPRLTLINDLVCFSSTLSHYLFESPVWPRF
jgi:hypothetical protein